jgi:hypothetical protein
LCSTVSIEHTLRTKPFVDRFQLPFNRQDGPDIEVDVVGVANFRVIAFWLVGLAPGGDEMVDGGSIGESASPAVEATASTLTIRPARRLPRVLRILRQNLVAESTLERAEFIAERSGKRRN